MTGGTERGLCTPLPASGSRPGSSLPGSRPSGSGMLQAARRVPCALGGLEERGGGRGALARAVPAGRAGWGLEDAQLIAAVLPLHFGFI